MNLDKRAIHVGSKLGVTLLVVFLTITCLPGKAHTSERMRIPELNLPKKYGKIIYRTPGTKDRRIFIVFQAHRSSVNGRNSRVIVEAQSDIYRIEEWLVQRQNVELLLPEGFFQKKGASGEGPDVEPASSAGEGGVRIRPLEDATLRRRLSDATEFMNADRLLSRSSNIRLRQIEDRELYFEISRSLSGLKKSGSSLENQGRNRLDRLQKKRSARMLQKLPRIIEEELEAGRIGSRRAIFTIGMAHAPEILGFVKKGRIAGRFLEQNDPAAMRGLNLTESGYQIAMIVPDALLDMLDSFPAFQELG